MEKFLLTILKPVYGKHAFVLAVFFSIVPIAFLNIPLWISIVLLLAVNALMFTVPSLGSLLSDVIYIWALITTLMNPIDVFSIIFFILFAYRALCMYGNYKLANTDKMQK